MKKQKKLGFLALIGLVAVCCESNTNFETKSRRHRAARLLSLMVAMSSLLLFTVCKATGVGGDLFSTVIDQTIEVAYGEEGFRALQPTEKKLLSIVMPVDAEDPDKPAEIGEIALSDGEYILGVKIGEFAAEKYILKVYDLDLDGDNNPDTPAAGTPQWPLGATRRAVTFELDGGSLSGANPQIVNAGESVTRPEPDPYKADYTFDGWWSEAALATVYDFTSPVSANISVWAKWASSTPPAPAPSPIPATMVSLAGGTFTMGSPDTEANRYDNEGPQHQVTVSSFYMGKYEVTQKEYFDTMESWPNDSAPSGTYGEGDSYPIYWVTWYDAIEYCNKRSEDENLTPAYTVSGEDVAWNKSANGYRLPTEAEWEYACRAGTTSPYSSESSVGDIGWYYDNSGNKAHPVGEKLANAWGLYDMHGNVYERCWDWYAAYESGPLTDPDGALSGTTRVYRSGGWYSSAKNLRSATRGYVIPSGRDSATGFRLVRNGE